MLALTDAALAPLYLLRHGPGQITGRALELLASRRDGCTEAIMIAHGFTVAPTRRARDRAGRGVVAGGRSIEVARVRITEAGRRGAGEFRRLI